MRHVGIRGEREFRRMGGTDGGSALVLAVVAIVLLSGIAGAFFSVEGSRLQASVARAEKDRSFPIAESGVDEVAVLLSSNAWSANSALDWSADGIDNDGDGLADEGDETLVATADLWAEDAVDNDEDGEIDEPDEGLARVACWASIGRSWTRLTGWLRRTSAQLPFPLAAVYLDDPLADVRFSGNSFQINGNDTNLDGTSGPMDPVLGIGINGDPQQVLDQFSLTQKDNVTGSGGWPSVGSLTSYPPDFIQSYVDVLGTEATILFPNGYSQGTYTEDLGNWEAGQYEITYSRGDLEIGGGSSGAGILLVDGNLEITGNWDYVGFVFVTGEVTFKGGGGTKRLRGPLFVDGDVEQASPTWDLTVTGTVDIQFSSEALRFVRRAFTRYRVTAITEP